MTRGRPARSAPPEPLRPEPASRRSALTTISWLLVIAAALGFLVIIRRILLPFVLAVIIAYVCTPLIDRLARRLHGPRWIFALLVFLCLMGIAAVLGYFGIPAAEHEVLALAAHPRQVIEGFVRVLMGNRSFNIGGASLNAAQIAEHAAVGLSTIVTNGARLTHAAITGVTGVFQMMLTCIVMGYLLFDAPRLSRGLVWTIPPARRAAAHVFWRRLDPILRRYFIGIALVVVYATTAAFVGLGLFLDLRHALILAVLTGLLELLPLVGPLASAVLAGLVAVRQAASASAILAYVIYAIALRVSIDEFFGPLVLGRAAYVRPVLVIFSFLSGAILLGISGIILAVPTVLAIKVALAMRNEKHERSQSGQGGEGACP